MAIRRCPYCKAIIEEGAEYCSNCGTQLLFPEDEKIEEEIPGEKILDDGSDDDDEAEESELAEEDKDVDPVAGDLLDSAEEENPPFLVEEEVEPTEPVEKKTEISENLQNDEIGHDKEVIIQEKKDVTDDLLLEEHEILSEDEEEESDEEKEWNEEEELENEISLEGIDEEVVFKEIEKESLSDSEEDVLKMEDLEKTVESSEIEKQEIDRFIDSMRQDQGEDIAFVPFPKEPLIEEPVLEEPVIVPPTDDLPAWASKIKEKPPSGIPMTESEKEFVPQEKTPTLDTGIGLPEVVAQKELPFSGDTVETEEAIPKELPSQISIWIKSRVFDVLFIGAVWFITTWIASYVMEVKLFKLISTAALLLMVFYLVLLTAYLFLFFYFLGETLGDYLFNPKHRSELHHPA